MRVVVVHNYYDSRMPSGENTAVDDELLLLPQAGIDVVPMLSSSDQLLGSKREVAKVAGAPLWSPRSRRQLRDLLERTRPDLVHVHNLYPRPGPSVLPVARAKQIPVVQTVHNRRISCIAATHFRDGRPCSDCVARRVQWPGAVHACYRGSNAQSIVMASSNSIHHAALRDLQHYFAVSDSIAEVLVSSGVPRDRITVKPNPVTDLGVTPFPDVVRVLYAGRLEETKGARLLLDSWRALPRQQRPRLRICGAGPLSAEYEAAAREHDDLELVGQVSPADVRMHIAQSTSIVVPSIAGEGLPRVVAEAFAAGRPILATDHDPLASVVARTRGWRFAPDNGALAERLSAVFHLTDRERQALSAAARRYYEEHYGPRDVLSLQRHVYEQVVAAGVHP